MSLSDMLYKILSEGYSPSEYGGKGILIAMLASIGLIAVVWLIAGAVMRLGCRPSMPAWILLPGIM